MIKIAFFDIDGTLLKMGHSELSERTKQALLSLQNKGVLLCLATGRGNMGLPQFHDVNFDVILTFNGSYIQTKDKVIFKNPLDESDKFQIIRNLKDMHRAIAISNDHLLVTNGTEPDLAQYFAFGNQPMHIVENFDEISKQDIYQIMCACTKDEYKKVLQGTKHTEITAWWDRAVDIIPKDCGKGNAVNEVLKYYGFSKEEAIAFGDGENDIAMLEAVGTGIAMGNAKDAVKERADLTCKSVEEDGIYEYCLANHLM